MTRATFALAALVLALPGRADDLAGDAAADEAFFEFLGSFGDDEEGWVDPVELARAAQVSHALAGEDGQDDDDGDGTMDDE